MREIIAPSSGIEAERAARAPRADGESIVLRRRTLLAGLGAIVLVPAAAGCTVAVGDAPAGSELEAPTSSSSALGVGRELRRFLYLSHLLTGFVRLEASIGWLYLDELLADPARVQALDRLYELAGFAAGDAPRNYEELEATGVFADEAIRALTDRIITQWYSGLYEAEQSVHVATFTRALMWRVEGQSAPTTRGGPPGFWALPPTV